MHKVDYNDVAKGDLDHLEVFEVTHEFIVPVHLLLKLDGGFIIEVPYLLVVEKGHGLDQADDDRVDEIGDA